MKNFLSSFLHALLYSFHPKMLFLTLLPVLFFGGMGFALNHFFGAQILEAIQLFLQSNWLYTTLLAWLHNFGWDFANSVLPTIILIYLLSPLVVLLSLLFIELAVAPVANRLVAQKCFPQLERRPERQWGTNALWISSSYLWAVLLLFFSLPLWFIPPLGTFIPALIFGWLLYRVMAFDALSGFANNSERKSVMQQQRHWLITIGFCLGLLTSFFSLSSMFGLLSVFLLFAFLPFMVWAYAFTFVFSTLWFAHFCLSSLQQLRTQENSASQRQQPSTGKPFNPSATEPTTAPTPNLAPLGFGSNATKDPHQPKA